MKSRFVIRVCQRCERVHDECSCPTPELTSLIVERVIGKVGVHLSPESMALKQR